MMACLFLAGIDTGRYARCIDELNNSAMGGNMDKYPKTVKDAVNYASERGVFRQYHQKQQQQHSSEYKPAVIFVHSVCFCVVCAAPHKPHKPHKNT